MPTRKFVAAAAERESPRRSIHPELGVTISELLINVKDDEDPSVSRLSRASAMALKRRCCCSVSFCLLLFATSSFPR